jgi:Flp pilus assembly protein TadG
MLWRALRDERGSSPVEFVLVGSLLTVLTLAVLQLGLAMYVRNVVHDAAAEGAHYAALADTSAQDGAARTADVITTAIGAEYAGDIEAYTRVSRDMTWSQYAFARHCLCSGSSAFRSGWRWKRMHPWRRWVRNEDGSAALEFIVVGVILLVPLVYLILTLGAVQENTLGAEAAARHAARAMGQAPDAVTAASRADAILANVIDEYGMEADSVVVSTACSPASVECPSSGATVIVTVSARVSLPFVPPLFGLDTLAAIPVEAQAAQKISRLWGTP